MEAESCLDDHSRTIIHMDIDCFYAQVEIMKKPELRTLPLGIKQKNIVVTSNYVARDFGIKKCMLITEAKRLCPDLVLVNGEDLHDYRQTSYKVTTLLQKYSNLVERLGLDENFIDVTNLVNEKLKNYVKVKITGNVFGDTSDLCDCGCSDRLKVGTNVAQEIRDHVKLELGLTTCVGIGHNKLLAKLACSKFKPNQQTVVFPNSAVELMTSLDDISRIPGIGVTLTEQLNDIKIKTVEELQSANFSTLKNLLGPEKAKTVHDLSFGVDKTLVKSTGKPQSIGIEDSCKAISVEKEVKEKFRQLLSRLLRLVAEDGRTPKTLKVTIRKFDKNSKISNRETRQCNISTTLFNPKDITKLTENNENKIMTNIMRLFCKLVNTDKPYHITLLGLSFTKFVEQPNAKSGLTRFLVKDIEVQSITNIENLNAKQTTPKMSPSTSYAADIETESEPIPKKFKFSDLITKKRCLNDSDDCSSPSKLKVAELRLNSTEKPMDTNQNISCPPNASEEIFRELPREVQQELWEDYKQSKEKEKVCPSQSKKTKPNSILNYLVKR